jgi:hypothetical protein
VVVVLVLVVMDDHRVVMGGDGVVARCSWCQVVVTGGGVGNR